MGFKLATLLDLRRVAEDEARKALGQASAMHADAEDEQQRLQDLAARAREHRDREKARLDVESPASPADGVARERYRQRLQDAVVQADAAAHCHREGPLREAAAAEDSTRQAYAQARQEREVLDKIRARAEDEERKLAERRAEDEAADLAQAAFARRSPHD